MINSVICQDLGIKYPVFQGGMAWIADASLASAVSNAGGLGIIAGMNMNGEQLKEEIRKTRTLTDKPFGVNIMLMSPFAEEVSDVVIEEKVPVITTGAGNPVIYMKKWLAAGIKVIPVVASVALAKMVERRGAYAVVAEGGESGGHIGELATMPLVREVCSAVKIPVIAAGGIADGAGLAAAFMLGASGVQMGTRFLVADECTAHENYKQMVLKAGDRDTIVTGRKSGHPVRALKTPFSRQYKEKEEDAAVTAEELDLLGRGALRRAAKEGDTETGSFLCGEVAGLVTKKESAADIVRSVCEEAELLFKGAAQWVK
ncbi:MAG: enoyl-[acyl-carrier-protein] reductase FabK [Clostridia bacterium]|nr:enoyl-[acyl-carrier-protein] reductase FabK [Clostridia bacterium]